MIRRGLFIHGTGAPGRPLPETPYGTFSGTRALAAGATQFNGSFGPTSPIPGTFAGAFFGSQAEQIGVSFAGSGVVAGADTRIAGAIVGKKN